LKPNLFRYFAILGFTVLFIACSTKRNTFLSRGSHALATEYNILYNGQLALDAGLAELQLSPDNFWERLPIEPMQPAPDEMNPGQQRNANFERAEEKAIKAIQKHSMNIGGAEKNPQMDEAHLMLGKARYYDNRFVPALEAFNYVLYKYPSSDKIYEVKVWREKTNIRMENDQLAVNNLQKMLGEIKLKDQVSADAHAMMAQAFLNLEEKDSAMIKLKTAISFTRRNHEKARYRFILGQLYEEMGYPDSAFVAYQSVIDMKRKSPRQYVIQAHARQSLQLDPKSSDTAAFVKKFEKLLRDRENRPYLGTLNHQVALYYDKSENDSRAEEYYKRSLKYKNENQYLVASNYRNIAELKFDNARYAEAGQYYDSTMTRLNPRSREFKQIRKKRENLEDVIKYEGIATANDSILRIAAMSESARQKFFEDYVAKLKKADELARARQEQAEKEASNASGQGNDPKGTGGVDPMNMPRGTAVEGRGVAGGRTPGNASIAGPVGADGPTAGIGKETDFYFYSTASVAYGKNEFRKTWGDRAHVANWRRVSVAPGKENSPVASNDASGDAGKGSTESSEERYNPVTYIERIPSDLKVLDSLAKDRNFAYYQLGLIYKEKFKEYERAAEKLESLLLNKPEERLVLPAMYNLFKIYEIIDKPKSEQIRSRIISEFPDSRYAQILSNAGGGAAVVQAPDAAYEVLYKRLNAGDYKNVLAEAELATEQYAGEEINSKFELLKAQAIGKLRGVEEYRKALNFVALNYPSSAEGKEAEALLAKQIPALANLKFSNSETSNWKILYRTGNPSDKSTQNLMDKVKKYLAYRGEKKLTWSFDLYTETENLLVIHGLRSEVMAGDIGTILRDVKEFSVLEPFIVISGQNYEVVQIKKNLDEYLTNPEKMEISVTNQLPFTPAARQTAAPSQTPSNQVPPQSQSPGDAQGKPSTQQSSQQTRGNQPQQSPPPGQLGGPPPIPMQQPATL
jgi:tetratricopeptide (TPR) repeat protein